MWRPALSATKPTMAMRCHCTSTRRHLLLSTDWRRDQPHQPDASGADGGHGLRQVSGAVQVCSYGSIHKTRAPKGALTRAPGYARALVCATCSWRSARSSTPAPPSPPSLPPPPPPQPAPPPPAPAPPQLQVVLRRRADQARLSQRGLGRVLPAAPGHWCVFVCVFVGVCVCVCVKEHKENVVCMCVRGRGRGQGVAEGRG